MATYFREKRDCELSILYYLETSFTTDWSNITILKTFNQAYSNDYSLPIVVVSLANTTPSRLEVGSDTLDNRHRIAIHIFATSEAQRLDIADYVNDKLKDGCVYYEHSHVSGDKSSLDRVANGRLRVMEWISDEKFEIGEIVDNKDKYRHVIMVTVRKSL